MCVIEVNLNILKTTLINRTRLRTKGAGYPQAQMSALVSSNLAVLLEVKTTRSSALWVRVLTRVPDSARLLCVNRDGRKIEGSSGVTRIEKERNVVYWKTNGKINNDLQ